MTFSALGTLRVAQNDPTIPSAELDFEKFIDALRPGCDSHDVGESVLILAAALCRRGALTGEQREAFLLVLLCGVVAAQRGSTYVPILDTTLADEAEVQRILHGLVAPTDETRVAAWPAETVLERLRTFLRSSPAMVSIATESSSVAELRQPLVLDQNNLYAHVHYVLEKALIAKLAKRIQTEPVFVERTGEDAVFLDALPATMTLDPEQRYAIRAAARGRVTVISGGPGTGKTTILLALWRYLVALQVPANAIFFAAPTGKATNRMEQALREAMGSLKEGEAPPFQLPQTIHRLLGYAPSADNFKVHAGNPLACKVLIVDEASMVDLFLMDQLLDALPDDAQLVLLGDADQLPSVDTGAVLADLMTLDQGVVTELWAAANQGVAGAAVPEKSIAAGAVKRSLLIAKLTRGHRAESQLKTLGAAMQSGSAETAWGQVAAALGTPLGETEQPGYQSVEWIAFAETDDETARRKTFRANKDRLTGVVENWYETRLKGQPEFLSLIQKPYVLEGDKFGVEDVKRLEFLDQILHGCRMLCVTRVMPTGADAVNRQMHQLHGKAVNQPAEDKFYPGEPVMVRKNDYQHQLFNGDQGMIVSVVEPGQTGSRLMVVFRRAMEFKAFALATLRGRIELAYAMTVHKSQGSEFEHVAVVFPQAKMALVSRQIFYTGVTRAKKSVLVVGGPQVVQYAVEHRDRRWSGVGRGLG